VLFPVSGLEVNPVLPAAAALVISFFTSMSGVSGAVLLLPFQMGILGYSAAGVSATNLVFNVIGTPAGVLGYIHERRMSWPLARFVVSRLVPGEVMGVLVRVGFMLDSRVFRIFAGLVIFAVVISLAVRELQVVRRRRGARGAERDAGSLGTGEMRVLGVVCLLVGILSAAYGMGGGALLAGVLLGGWNLSVRQVAGTMLFANFCSSVAGAATYAAAGRVLGHPTLSPDFRLGVLLGLGGMAGMYLGARMQKYFPVRLIRMFLIIVLLVVATRYVTGLPWGHRP